MRGSPQADRLTSWTGLAEATQGDEGAAVALLDAALRDYAARGFTCCSVDFESFNPEAAAFWMKYFEPGCFSLLRVPEISEW